MSSESKTVEGNQLDQLSKMTVIVADTGDINTIKLFTPDDATTNPSLVYKAVQMEEYKHLATQAIEFARAAGTSSDEELMALVLDRLAVNFGIEILKIVPGYVSTEVDARLSFDLDATLTRARRIIKMYEDQGISRDRVLIKLATTWEGCRAAEVLEKEGIHCNMTLLFSFCQAVAAAEVGATLISPFVGRIMDWHKADQGVAGFTPEEDPGVASVTKIYNYYKSQGYKTIVMGASFRSTGEILALAGCDRLTIGPNFLQEMSTTVAPVELKLSAETAGTSEKVTYTEAEFRWALNEDACATEKLAEGIRNFTKDLRKLEDIIRGML